MDKLLRLFGLFMLGCVAGILIHIWYLDKANQPVVDMLPDIPLHMVSDSATDTSAIKFDGIPNRTKAKKDSSHPLSSDSSSDSCPSFSVHLASQSSEAWNAQGLDSVSVDYAWPSGLRTFFFFGSPARLKTQPVVQNIPSPHHSVYGVSPILTTGVSVAYLFGQRRKQTALDMTARLGHVDTRLEYRVAEKEKPDWRFEVRRWWRVF